MNNGLIDRLIFAIGSERGAKARIAKACGIAPQAITGWIKRGTVERGHLPVVAMETGVSLEWLMTGNGDPFSGSLGIPLRSSDLVPIISTISAGLFCESSDLFSPGDSDEWIACPPIHSKRTYALRVEGDSMTSNVLGEKSYPHGTIIFVDPDKQYTTGSKVVAKIPNTEKAVFKKYGEDMGVSYLIPLNPTYPTIPMPEGTVICGVVIGAFTAE